MDIWALHDLVLLKLFRYQGCADSISIHPILFFKKINAGFKVNRIESLETNVWVRGEVLLWRSFYWTNEIVLINELSAVLINRKKMQLNILYMSLDKARNNYIHNPQASMFIYKYKNQGGRQRRSTFTLSVAISMSTTRFLKLSSVNHSKWMEINITVTDVNGPPTVAAHWLHRLP